jgi:hypothetical protein
MVAQLRDFRDDAVTGRAAIPSVTRPPVKGAIGRRIPEFFDPAPDLY